MTYIIRKILLSLKTTEIMLKKLFSNMSSKSIIDFFFFFFLQKLNNFFITYNDEKFKAWKRQRKKRKTVKNIKNIFRLKKEIDETTV